MSKLDWPPNVVICTFNKIFKRFFTTYERYALPALLTIICSKCINFLGQEKKEFKFNREPDVEMIRKADLLTDPWNIGRFNGKHQEKNN